LFKSSVDLGEKVEKLDLLADGIFPLIDEGDLNIGTSKKKFLMSFLRQEQHRSSHLTS
jgi:hypothetical protein